MRYAIYGYLVIGFLFYLRALGYARAKGHGWGESLLGCAFIAPFWPLLAVAGLLYRVWTSGRRAAKIVKVNKQLDESLAVLREIRAKSAGAK